MDKIKDVKLYVLLVVVQSFAIGLYGAICALGIAAPWLKIEVEPSFSLAVLVFCLIYVIIKTGREIDKQLEVTNERKMD